MGIVMLVDSRRRNGGGGGAGGQAPSPIFYPRDFINIHTCSADRRDRGVYYVRPPPKWNCFLRVAAECSLPYLHAQAKLDILSQSWMETSFCKVLIQLLTCACATSACSCKKISETSTTIKVLDGLHGTVEIQPHGI